VLTDGSLYGVQDFPSNLITVTDHWT